MGSEMCIRDRSYDFLSSCQYCQNGKAPLIVCDDVITPGDLPSDMLTAEPRRAHTRKPRFGKRGAGPTDDKPRAEDKPSLDYAEARRRKAKPTDDKPRAEDKTRLDFAEARRRKTKSKALFECNTLLIIECFRRLSRRGLCPLLNLLRLQRAIYGDHDNPGCRSLRSLCPGLWANPPSSDLIGLSARCLAALKNTIS